MKRVFWACFAFVFGTAYAASDSEFLLWMVDNPTVVTDDGTTSLAAFLEDKGDVSARVAVSGGDLSGDTYLNIYSSPDGKTWSISPSPVIDVSTGYAGPIWSGLGDYNSSVYSFTIELGNYDFSSDAWTVLARSETASYQTLREEWATNAHVGDVPGTIEWTGGTYTAVPEPSGGMLFLLGGMILALRRRRSAIPARVSRPLVAVLALVLVFSVDAATLTFHNDFRSDGSTVTVPLVYEDESGNALTGPDKVFTIGSQTGKTYPDANPDAGYAMDVRDPGEQQWWGYYNPSIITLLKLKKISVNDGWYEFKQAFVLIGEEWKAFSSLSNKGLDIFDVWCDGGSRDVGTWKMTIYGDATYEIDKHQIKLVYAESETGPEEDDPGEDDPGGDEGTVVPAYEAAGWSALESTTNNVFAGVKPQLVADGSCASLDHEGYFNDHISNGGGSVVIDLLTDGEATVPSSHDYKQYIVRDGAQIVFPLPAAADISEFRFYSSWIDNGRAGIAVTSIEVQNTANGPWTAIDGSAFRLCADGATIPDGPQWERGSMARRVRFFDENEGMLATNVVAVKVTFGVQDYYWSGYAEIEALGSMGEYDPGEDDPGEDDPGEDDPGEEGAVKFEASSWRTGDFVPMTDNVFAGIEPDLVTKGNAGDYEANINESLSDIRVLTDGRCCSTNEQGAVTDQEVRYAIRDGAEIVWTLAEPADLSEFRFYATWGDGGRAGIAISSIEVQTVADAQDQWRKIGGSTFRWCANGENTIEGLPSESRKRFVSFSKQGGGNLATSVVAVKVTFDVQDNFWSGYAEIEAKGTQSHVGDDPLLRDVVAISTNTFGMATIYSSDTNTIVAVPWTWYSRREEDAGPIFAEKLVSPENLSAGDFLVLLTDATGNATSKAAGYAAWTLDENLKWQPTATVACAPEGGLAHTTVLAGSNDTVARGYGIWLLRTNPLNEDGTPKPFHVYGQFVSQGTTVTVKGGGTRTAPVFTMLADPYLREVKVNEDIDWGSNPGSLDSLAIVTDQTTFQYCKWNGTQWWYSKVTYDETKHMNVTERITDIRVPAGAGFWYVRRTDGDFSVTWGENK